MVHKRRLFAGCCESRCDEAGRPCAAAGVGDLENPDMFVKLTEENRRERQRRIDAGDETARLKFSTLAIQQPAAVAKAVGSVAAAIGGAIRPTGASVRPAA